MEKNDISEEEVVTPVLRDIELLFKKMYQVGKKVFFAVVDIVRLLLNFALKKVVILAIAAALGGAITYFSGNYFGKSYESSLMLKSNVNTWEQLVDDVHYFNALIAEGQVSTLAKTLKISEKEAGYLSSIEIEPSATYAQKIGMIEVLNQNSDSLTLQTVNQKKLMKIEDMAFTENYNISIKSSNGYVFPKIEKALVEYFEGSATVQAKLQRKRARVQSELASHRKKLIDMDTLQHVLNEAILENAKSGNDKKITSISMDSETISRSISPIEVSDKYLGYKRKIVDMEERLTTFDSAYEIVSHLSQYGRETGRSKFSKVIYYSLYSILGAYLLLLLFYFMKKKPLDA
ncbi:MAG: hypothetical protein AB8B56_04010 [Crocinitomicaceae bacterium]